MNNTQLELWNNLNEKNTLREVQNYIKDVITIRGFENQEIEKNNVITFGRSWRISKGYKKKCY